MKGNLFHQMQFKIWKNNHNFYNFTDISVTHFVFNENQSRFQKSHRQYMHARAWLLNKIENQLFEFALVFSEILNFTKIALEVSKRGIFSMNLSYFQKS